MNKIILFIKTHYRLLIVAIVVIITLSMLIRKCTHSLKNEVITDGYIAVQKTERGKFSDSLNYSTQAVLLAQTQAHVTLLESTLQKELSRKIKISKTTMSIEYKDSIVYIKIPGKRDTVYVPTKEYVAKFPMKFKNENKYIKQSYTVYSPDSSSIDQLTINNTGHIVIGEKGKWYQKKTLILGILNENPYILVDTLHSVFYKAPETWHVSAGPVLLINKTGTSAGVGITFKKGFFSGTIGYKFY